MRAYRAIVYDSSDTPETQELREALVRTLAPLRSIVQSLVGKRVIVQFGQVYDPWAEGLRRYIRGWTPSSFSFCLDGIVDDLNAALGILETKYSDEILTLRSLARGKPAVFVSHGGETPLRNSLELFLWKAGVTPVVVEDIPDASRNPDQKVHDSITNSDFAVVLIEKARTSSQDGRLLPRGNVIDEIERIRTILGARFVVLLEEGVDLPSNLSTAISWEQFAPESFDSALLKIMRYLQRHGLA